MFSISWSTNHCSFTFFALLNLYFPSITEKRETWFSTLISMLLKFWMALFSPQQTQQTAVNTLTRLTLQKALQTCSMWVHLQTKHKTNYKECFFAVQSGQVQEALSFSSPSPPIRNSPFTRPPLACQSLPSGDRLERDKRGRRARERERG